MKTNKWIFAGAAFLAATALNAQSVSAQAMNARNKDSDNGCGSLPGNTTLRRALLAARTAEDSGQNAQQWATIVDRDGTVCAVAFTGFDRSAQLGIGRISSAMRANTANSFAYDSSSGSNGKGYPTGLALSTANLFSSTQPGGFVAGLPDNYPVNQAAAFSLHPDLNGTASDPMVGQRIGGFSAIGGGLALFGAGQTVMGAVGVSGDHSCTDHDVAWRLRNLLGYDHLAGLPPLSGDLSHPDNIVYDITPNPNGGTGKSLSGLGHPGCPNQGDQTKLPAVRP